jgi:hypothetical protein
MSYANVWRSIDLGTNAPMYEDHTMGGTFAISTRRISNTTQIYFQPQADGTPNIDFWLTVALSTSHLTHLHHEQEPHMMMKTKMLTALALILCACSVDAEDPPVGDTESTPETQDAEDLNNDSVSVEDFHSTDTESTSDVEDQRDTDTPEICSPWKPPCPCDTTIYDPDPVFGYKCCVGPTMGYSCMTSQPPPSMGGWIPTDYEFGDRCPEEYPTCPWVVSGASP